jgi:hypothetical protein
MELRNSGKKTRAEMRMKVEKHMEHLDTICAPPSVISATQFLSF